MLMFGTIKKVAVIIAIAVLFSFFAFSLVEAVRPSPKWDDYCYETAMAERSMAYPKALKEARADCPDLSVPQRDIGSCGALKGRITYTYDSLGCPASFRCDTCEVEYEKANKEFIRLAFIVTGIIGLLAIIAGIYVSPKSPPLEWVMSGFLIGGVFIILRGTMVYFEELGRYVRPIVLLIEMALIVFIAVKIYMKRSK
jgi:hypothetical protein